MYPAFDANGKIKDWLLWMWHGSFYDTSTHGDRWLGWHVNHQNVMAGRPEFYRLEWFKGHYHREQVIDELLRTRDVAATHRDEAAFGKNPVQRQFRFLDQPAVALRVDTTKPDGVAVMPSVQPRGSDDKLFPARIELWLNDHRYRVWSNEKAAVFDPKKPFQDTLTIPAKEFRSGSNTVTLLSINALGGRSEAQAVVMNPRPPAARNLHGLAVGINDYASHRTAFEKWRAASPERGGRAFGDLNFATDDACSLTGRFNKLRGPDRPFAGGTGLRIRTDEQATKEQQRADLKAVAAVAQPDDLLILFFAGHGADPDVTRLVRMPLMPARKSAW